MSILMDEGVGLIDMLKGSFFQVAGFVSTFLSLESFGAQVNLHHVATI
jgi:hypothetical protein